MSSCKVWAESSQLAASRLIPKTIHETAVQTPRPMTDGFEWFSWVTLTPPMDPLGSLMDPLGTSGGTVHALSSCAGRHSCNENGSHLQLLFNRTCTSTKSKRALRVTTDLPNMSRSLHMHGSWSPGTRLPGLAHLP